MTDTKAWAALLCATILVALTTWHREFGEIVAGVVLALSLVFCLFCAYLYLQGRVTGETRRTGRALHEYGRWFVWLFVAPAPIVVAAWIVAIKLLD